MKQKFTKQQHLKFIKYFKIKKEPSKIENKFYKKTEKYLKFVKWIPGIKMIGIGNSISMNCSSSDSDIDLLVVTEENRMWLVRILMTFIFQILGIRKTKNKHAGRFCLSFFCTTRELNFGGFAIKNDIYLYFWILYFKPILDYDKTYEKFIGKNSKWADFSEYIDMIEENKKYIKYYANNSDIEIRKIGDRGFLNLINNFLKNKFLPKTKKSYQKLGHPFGVIISDDMLKFHDNDIRREISNKLI